MTKKIKLAPGQTMAQYQRQQQFDTDCAQVAKVIDTKPGISGRWAIADETGLSLARVKDCMVWINDPDTFYMRVDYGWITPKSGPYAGKQVRGWYPMRLATYHPVMDQADQHSHEITKGIKKSRVIRLLAAKGMSSAAAAAAVDSILVRLDMDPATMTQADWDALADLVMDEA